MAMILYRPGVSLTEAGVLLVRDEMTYRDKVIPSLTKSIAMAMPGAVNEALWRRPVER